jgi:voltage-gated potassium channel Kch
MRRIWNAFARFWQAEQSLSVLLFILVMSEFIVPVIAPDRGARDPLAGTFLSFVLIAGAATVWRHARAAVRLVILGVCLGAIAVWWAAWLNPSGLLAAWRPASTAVVLAALAMVVVSSVLRAGTVTRHQIQGAIAAFLLLGLAWASAYEFVALRDPLAFRGLGATDAMEWTYYSFVTLTTVGYGDITPVAPAARSLAVAEAITGLMYVAILISRLVALSLHSRESTAS